MYVFRESFWFACNSELDGAVLNASESPDGLDCELRSCTTGLPRWTVEVSRLRSAGPFPKERPDMRSFSRGPYRAGRRHLPCRPQRPQASDAASRLAGGFAIRRGERDAAPVLPCPADRQRLAVVETPLTGIDRLAAPRGGPRKPPPTFYIFPRITRVPEPRTLGNRSVSSKARNGGRGFSSPRQQTAVPDGDMPTLPQRALACPSFSPTRRCRRR